MEIRFCEKEEIPQLISFFEKYWSKDHIFVKHPDVLLWQHQRRDGGLNYLIGVDKGVIWSIMGLIPLSHFDPDLESEKSAWGALWKTRPDCKLPGIGTLLQLYATKQYSYYGGLGLSQDNINIQKSLKVDVVELNHYYILNPLINEYEIARIPYLNTNITCNSKDVNFDLVEIKDFDKLPDIKHAYRPLKTNRFVQNKYCNNPYYKYTFLGCQSNKMECVLVGKRVKVGNRGALRIVDILGDLGHLKGLGYALKTYISQFDDIEYVDLYNHGIDPQYFLQGGFNILRMNDESIIIPNYFEPFVRDNCILQGFHVAKNVDNCVFFKADADQDRPNIIL